MLSVIHVICEISRCRCHKWSLICQHSRQGLGNIEASISKLFDVRKHRLFVNKQNYESYFYHNFLSSPISSFWTSSSPQSSPPSSSYSQTLMDYHHKVLSDFCCCCKREMSRMRRERVNKFFMCTAYVIQNIHKHRLSKAVCRTNPSVFPFSVESIGGIC